MTPKHLAAGAAAVLSLGLLAVMTARTTGMGRSVRSSDAARTSSDPAPQPPPAHNETTEAAPGGWVSDDAPTIPARHTNAVAVTDRTPAWAREPSAAEAIDADYLPHSDNPTDFQDRLLLATEDLADRGAQALGVQRSVVSGALRTWRTFIGPLLAGDDLAFVEGVRLLGGLASDPDGPAASVFDQLEPLIARAEPGLGAATVRTPTPRDIPRMPTLPAGVALDGVPMLAMVIQTRDDTTGETIERSAIHIPLEVLFPGTAEIMPLITDNAHDASGAPRVLEIHAPTRFAGSRSPGGDAGLSLFVARTQPDQPWTPIAIRLTLDTAVARDALAAARTRRDR